MYDKYLETNAKAKREHDANQKAIAAKRRAKKSKQSTPVLV